MVHSVSGWTRSVQVKLWYPYRTHSILSAWEVCSRQGTTCIQIHVYLYLYLRRCCITASTRTLRLSFLWWRDRGIEGPSRSNLDKLFTPVPLSPIISYWAKGDDGPTAEKVNRGPAYRRVDYQNHLRDVCL